MYRIIGADGNEYGPITADQLREWIREGRANGQTRARTEEIPDWRTLADMPEFAPALAAKSAPPLPALPPPLIGAVNADTLAAEMIARDYPVDIGGCIGRSWDLIQKNFWLTVGAATVVVLIEGMIYSIPYVGWIPGMLLTGPLHGSLAFMFLKLVRGERAEFGDAFAGFNLAFVPLMLCGLISGLLITTGIGACILPGIYLAVAWVLALPLVIDKKLDFWPAMEVSRKVITHHWWEVFGLLIVLFLLTFAGLFACFIGVFVTATIASGATVYFYEDVFGARPAASVGS